MSAFSGSLRPPFRLTPFIVSSQSFHSTSANLAARRSQRATTASPDISITKKKFSELPNFHVFPNGGEASPCSEWSGGLEDDKSDRQADTQASAGPSVVEAGPRKRRSSRRRVADEGSSLSQTEGSPLNKPKRRGRAKRQTDADATPPTQPRNQLATEILENLSRFPHCLLLTRVGQFYESYFDQAAEISRLLNIKFTSRVWDGHRIPMCGFPLVQLNKYLKILVQQHNRFVAMCEEFPRVATPDGQAGFDRRVVRVITPGTLIDEPFLNQYENNYILAVGVSADSQKSDSLGLAWIDVSTGEFFAKTSTHDGFRHDLARIGPREVVLDKWLEQHTTSHPVCQALNEEGNLVSYIGMADTELPTLEGADTTDDITTKPTPFSTSSLTDAETSAIKLLTTYLHAHLLEHMPQLGLPNREGSEGRMQIDAHTIHALEIRERMGEGGVAGSLLSVVRRTVTNSGTRLLARWLCSPSTSIKEINARQSLVAFLHARPDLRADLSVTLSKTDDVTRIVQKFLLGRAEPSDLLAISSTVSVWSSIQQRIRQEKILEERERNDVNVDEWSSIDALMSRMADLGELSKKITDALQDRPSDPQDSQQSSDPYSLFPASMNWRNEGISKWFIKPSFSNALLQLHQELAQLLDDREKLQEQLQKTYDALSLTLRSSPNHGMHVHLGRAKRDQKAIDSSDEFTRIAETGSTRCYLYQPWCTLGNQILQKNVALAAAEKEAFELLRSEVNAHSGPLRRNARILDELDVTLAFACLATETNMVRPIITDDITYEVVNGRHPTVETGLLKANRVFTPNTLAFTPASKLQIITGPNMAGKSTALRQTAIIAILAQTGAFVPADSATIGLVDKVFSRVGARDDLFRDRSTFMVEMLETAEILRHATPRSLVIMDEVGRGTTVHDGLAIAFATVHHLVTVNCCRALFATHFHELADILGHSQVDGGEARSRLFENVAFFCTDVDETADGHFAYSYRLKPGVNRESHGLRVAQLAGMPPSAITVAQGALKGLKSRAEAAAAAAKIEDRLDLGTLGRSLV